MSFLKLPVKLAILGALLTLLSTCSKHVKDETRPNILWIVLEDTAPLLGSYGTTIISTPHTDSLAQNGVVFTNAFMSAPVCSASRSSIITGMMSTTLGLHNHHSARTTESAIYLPDSVKTLPEVFKSAGYFTFNNGKDDYNFTYDRKDLYSQDYLQHPLYGKKGVNLDFSDIKKKGPFFGQIQLSGGKEIFSRTFKERVGTPVDREQIELPPYLPDHPAIVEEYANHLDAIQITDRKVGAIMEELRTNGLLNNTIVFFFSDHGMRITRNKQFLYDGGLQVPLILADFRKESKALKGSKNNQMVSGLDLGPTSLALAGIEIPSFMEGADIFDQESEGRKYVISTRDRCDFTIDRIRSVRSKEYKYIRNFMTDPPYTQPTYMDVDGVEFVKVTKQLHEENKLNEVQNRFFSDYRPAEELYDIQNDPFELNNLATNPDYTDVLSHYSTILEDWIKVTNDQGQYPENEEGWKLMLGIWGDHAINPEYEALRKKYPGLAGSQFPLKSRHWEKVENEK